LSYGGVFQLITEDLAGAGVLSHETVDAGLDWLVVVSVEGTNVGGGAGFAREGVEEMPQGTVLQEDGGDNLVHVSGAVGGRNVAGAAESIGITMTLTVAVFDHVLVVAESL
jgi:hypothetical protein